MLTNEQINIFQELHKQLSHKGYLYQFAYGSYGNEFFSIIQEKNSKATISKSLMDLNRPESQAELEAYRKLLISLIEAA